MSVEIKVLSEVNRNLEHAFLTAQRLDENEGQYPDLGRFLLAYYLEEAGEDIFLSHKPREAVRADLRKRLSGLRALMVGSIHPSGFLKYFGEAIKIENFFGLSQFGIFSGSEDFSKLGQFDFVYTRRIHGLVPSWSNIIEQKVYAELRKKFGIEYDSWGKATAPHAKTGCERDFALMNYDDELSRHRKLLTYLGLTLSSIEPDDLIGVKPAGLITCQDTTLPVLFSNICSAESLLSNLYTLMHNGYTHEVLERHLKPRGVIVDMAYNQSLESYSHNLMTGKTLDLVLMHNGPTSKYKSYDGETPTDYRIILKRVAAKQP